MITRPNIDDMLAGLTRNLERMAADASGTDLTPLFTPVLTALDRVALEWANTPALLAEDNDDIRRTLTALGAAVPPAAGTPTGVRSALATRTAVQVVAQLEQENRALKDALVAAIEAFDLPADAQASAHRQHADREVLALLQRMLVREDIVDVAPPRVGPTSGNPASAALSLEHLGSVLLRFIAAREPQATNVLLEGLQPLAGGASREAWVFDVRWQQDGTAHHEACILMREPLSSVLVSDESAQVINGTRRTVATELAIIRGLAAAGLPVPHVLWTDTEGVWLERPFSIARRLPGTANAGPIVGTELGDRVLGQYIEILARLHRLDPVAQGFGFLGAPTVHTAAIEQVRQFEHNFHAQRLEAYPATTYMIRWLHRHAPVASRVSLVHGDYRLGNFLYDERGIIAILDWEQAHLGDPLEEIAFMYWSAWSLGAMVPIETFVQRYEAAMGCTVDPAALAYYRVFIEFKMLVVLLTSVKSFFATPDYQLHYVSAPKMIRDSQRRVVEALLRGGPTVAFDAYAPAIAP